jgi:hypothetical protein
VVVSFLVLVFIAVIGLAFHGVTVNIFTVFTGLALVTPHIVTLNRAVYHFFNVK